MNVTRHPLSRPSLTLGALLTVAGAAVATPQAGPGAQTSVTPLPSSIFDTVHTVQEVSGDLWGVGADYKVRFEGDSWRFVPAFGDRVDISQHLAFELESITRGDHLIVDAQGATPAVDGTTVDYEHAPGVVERYEVEPQGMAQSFHFASPLAGSGDLVVKGTVDSSLFWDGQPDQGEGLTFTHPAGGSIHYGAVTGIDADGWTVPGSMRFDGSNLELRLPASFVDQAQWPLVLDPVIQFIIVEARANDSQPDVAYDVTENVYAVVWQQLFSTTDVDILLQRFWAGGPQKGLKAGPLVLVDTHLSTSTTSPQIANVNMTNRFLVTYEEDPLLNGSHDIKARAVDADPFGSISSPMTIASTSAHETGAQIGGERTTSFDQAMVVWQDNGFGVRGARVKVPNSSAALPDPVVDATFVVSPLPTDRAPQISKSGGEPGRWLVTWERNFPATPLDTNLYTRLFGRDTLPVTPEQLLASTGFDETQAVVDGDGDQFFMVAHLREDPALPGNRQVATQRVTLDIPKTSLDIGAIVINNTLTDESRIDVAFTGEAFVVAFTQEGVPGSKLYNAYVRAVDPFNNTILEPIEFSGSTELPLDETIGTDERQIAIASQFHGNPAITPGDVAGGDEAMIVWISHNPAEFFSGDVDGALFKTDTGVNQDLGGGCGDGGIAFATGAVNGNSAFTHRVIDAAPNRMAFYVMSSDLLAAPCGGCVLIPDPFTGFIGNPLGGMTDFLGEAAVLTPIPDFPALVGVEVFGQWVIDAAGPGACAALGSDLSNAISILIQ